MCASPYRRDTLQEFIANTTAKFKLNSTQDDDYLDKLYDAKIKYKQNSLITYPILHLSDLNVDLNYVAGASSDCRAWRCCNVDYVNGQIKWEVPEEFIANPFGHRGCDMPIGGTKAILHKLQQQLDARNFEPPSLVIVTGNVVTFQPG